MGGVAGRGQCCQCCHDRDDDENTGIVQQISELSTTELFEENCDIKKTCDVEKSGMPDSNFTGPSKSLSPGTLEEPPSEPPLWLEASPEQMALLTTPGQQAPTLQTAPPPSAGQQVEKVKGRPKKGGVKKEAKKKINKQEGNEAGAAKKDVEAVASAQLGNEAGRSSQRLEAPSVPPQLTKEEAAGALDRAISVIEAPENARKLKAAVKKCRAIRNEMEQELAMMTTVLPIAQAMLGDVLKEYGFPEDRLMLAMLQIKRHANGDEEMQERVERLTSFMQGHKS